MRGPARLRAGRFGQEEISFVNEPYSNYPFVLPVYVKNGHVRLLEEGYESIACMVLAAPKTHTFRFAPLGTASSGTCWW